MEHGAGAGLTELTVIHLDSKVIISEVFDDDSDEVDEQDESDIELDKSGEKVARSLPVHPKIKSTARLDKVGLVRTNIFVNGSIEGS